MSSDSKEHLSQLMDGELGGETGRFVLRRLEASGELRATWARYHLIRDCMRYQDRGFASSTLGSRVREAIDGLAGPGQQAVPANGNRWLRPVAGFGVAAAVALMAIVAVAPNLGNGNGVNGSQETALEGRPFTSPNITSQGLLSQPPVSRQVNLGGGEDARMSSYLLRHYQVAGASGGNGFVSFVPIVISKSANPQPAQGEAESRASAQAAVDSDKQ